MKEKKTQRESEKRKTNRKLLDFPFVHFNAVNCMRKFIHSTSEFKIKKKKNRLPI